MSTSSFSDRVLSSLATLRVPLHRENRGSGTSEAQSTPSSNFPGSESATPQPQPQPHVDSPSQAQPHAASQHPSQSPTSSSQTPLPSTTTTTTLPPSPKKKKKKSRTAFILFTMASALILILALAFISTPTPARSGEIPPSSGPFTFTLSHLDIQNGDRKLTTSIYYPVWRSHCTETCIEEYMPEATAKSLNALFYTHPNTSIFQQISYTKCCQTDSPLPLDNMTVVILEPQLGISRLLYGALAQEITSHGFTTLTIDHPSDPNLTLDPFSPLSAWNSTIGSAVAARSDDITFLVSQFGQRSFLDAAFSNFTTTGDRLGKTTGYGIAGHAFGGSVATSLSTSPSTTPSQFPISVNLAGTPPPLTNSTYQQVVFLGRHPSGRREDDINWPSTWKHLRGRATEFDMQGGGIFDYSDLPLITELAASEEQKGSVRGLGRIERGRAFGIAAQFTRGYMAAHFGGGAVELQGLVGVFKGDMKPYMAT